MTDTIEAPAVRSAPIGYHELPRRRLVLTVAGLMITLLLAALDQTIVGTAMPRVIAELQGFDHYAWVTTAYLLTSTAVVPIVGKLSDLYGRKLFLVGGTIFFLLASALCGLSQSMNQLIVFRGLQGLGGGVLMAMVFTVVSVIFPPASRGRVQGLFSGTFGLASIIGPVIGGYLTDNLSWRWVFYVNLPVGLLALGVLWFGFPNIKPARTNRPIDVAGAITLVLAVVPLLLALSWGGSEYPWSSTPIVGLLAFAAIMTAIFLLIETRAPEPIIPLSLFKNQIVSVSTLAMLLMSVGMFGTILFIPLFIQGVIGTNATQSGSVMMPMMLTMIVSSMVAGQIISRTSRYKLLGVAGLTTTAIGMFLLSRMGPETSYLTVVGFMMLIGLGLGPTMPVFTLAAQNAVEMRQLGVVTSLTQFSRSIGATLGAAIFGSLLANRFSPALHEALPPDVATVIPPERLAQLQNPQVLLNPQLSQGLRASLADLGPQGAVAYDGLIGAIKIALASSLHELFLDGSLIVLVGVVVVLFLKEIPLRKGHSDEPRSPTAGRPDRDLAGVGSDGPTERRREMSPV